MNPKTIAQRDLALLALFISLFLWWTYPRQGAPADELIAVGTTTRQVILFPHVEIEARAAYIYDAKNQKVVYQKNSDESLPLASIAKLMTAYIASTLIPDHVLVRISVDDIRSEGDTGLHPDEQWNIEKLIDYSLVVSSNDGISAIASTAAPQIVSPSSTTTSPSELFVNRMNDTARPLGRTSMSFANASGLDVSSTTAGAYGSAKDVALLVSHIVSYDPRLLEATSLSKGTFNSKEISHVGSNTDRSIDNIPNVLASKTGYTDLSGGNLVVEWNAGVDHPIVISILGSSYDGRFTDMEALVKATLEYLSKKAQ